MTINQTSYSAVLGAVLSGIRNQLGIEQSFMAAKLGLSQSGYSRLESGQASFTLDQLFQLAEALNMTSVELIQRINITVERLERSGVTVMPQLRGNSTQGKSGDGSGLGTFVKGAVLGGLLVGLLSKE